MGPARVASKPKEAPEQPVKEAPELPEKEIPEQAVWRDWSGRGQHVEFKEDEKVPLEPGETLGQGSNGFVVKTTCKGVVLAWKSKVYAPRDEPSILKEKDILMRLDHIHTVKMVGTYKHQHPLGRVEVGLLTWPVAVCDLSAFLKDVDHFSSSDENGVVRSPLDDQQKQRLESLGFDLSGTVDVVGAMSKRMCQSFGCLVSAVAHLHSKDIKHKDIKPANVLIYRDTIRLTDFGTSRDFSDLGMSATDNGGARGTAKYFSPETATWSSPGRPADIFSLGCVFLEMVYSILPDLSIAKLDELRPEADSSGRSYQANLANLNKWTDIGSPRHLAEHLMVEIRSMLERDPKTRPKAEELITRLNIISEFGAALHGPCCSQILKSRKESEGELKRSQREFTDLANTNRDLEMELQRLDQKNQENQGALRQWLEAYKDSEATAENRRTTIQELKRQLDAQKRDMAPLMQKLEMKTKELEESQNHVEKLEGTLTAYMKTSAENSRLKKEMLDKERQLSEMTQTITSLQDDRAKLARTMDARTHHLTQEIGKAEETRRAQEQRFQIELARVKKEGIAAKEEYLEMEVSLDQEQANSILLKRDIHHLQEQRRRANEERDAVYATFSSFGATFKRFEDEMGKHRNGKPARSLPAVSRSDSGYETRDSNASSLSSIVQGSSPSAANGYGSDH
jgi:serine/threonine protein kinase